MSPSQPVSSLLPLGHELLQHAALLTRLQQQLASSLPADLSCRCRIQNLRADTLRIEADGPVWANRLRYLLPSLQEQLRLLPELAQLRTIQVVVVPAQVAPARVPRRAALSAAAAKVLHESAQATTDPSLREALHRLARRAQRVTDENH